jgi:TonB-linked SusC/RagA family outer membrane protein
MRQLCLLVIAMLLSAATFAQTRQLTGTVKDGKSGSALPTVTVLVKGKNIAAVTTGDGSFSIKAPEGPITLQVSLVGYATKSVDVAAGQSTVDITLDESTTQLGELVVTALGIQKESGKVGYAVQKVDGAVMTKARETNVALSLGGRVAGLNVHGSSGGPGSSARIMLRGLPSMNSTTSGPLFVINGVPMDNTQRGAAGEWGGADQGDGIGNINPDDIESMTVLKGQAASALYGTRAANGVIQITTKSGKKGNLSVDYNMNYTVDQAINFTDYQYVYGQGRLGAKPSNAAEAQATSRLSWGSKLDGSSFTQFDGSSQNYSAYKDNIANFYRLGPTFTNTVAVSGGGDNGAFRLSMSNLNNDAIVRNSGLDRKTFSLNASQKIGKLDVKVLANYTDEMQKNKPNLSDGPLNVNNGLFLANNINESILKPGYDSTGKEVLWTDDNYVTNPWFVVNKFINDVSRKRFLSAITAKYDLASWLFVQGRVGYDLSNDRQFYIEPSGTDYTRNANFGNSTGSYKLRTTQFTELNTDLFLGAHTKVGADFDLSAVIGGNTLKKTMEFSQISGGPFVIPGLYAPKNVYNFDRDYDYYKRESHSGYYTIDLSYKNFLTLNTTGRYDAYSTLAGKGINSSNYGIFTPSVSASFVFSEVTKIPKLSYGKLRASFAQTSGEPAEAYQTQLYYDIQGTLSGIPLGKFSNTLPSGSLKPYKVSEVEVGAELKWFDNRLGLDVAYFNRKTEKEIMKATISGTSGFTSAYVATGSTKNTGIELQLNGTPVAGKDFTWNVSFNLTHVKNEILSTDENGNDVSLGTNRANPGSINTIFRKGMAGPQIYAAGWARDAKGNVIVDADGIPVAGPKKTWGSVLPTLYGGLNNDFSYKNWNLSFLIDYNYGNKVISASEAYTYFRGLNKATLVGRENGITTGVDASGNANTKSVSAQKYYQEMFTRVPGETSVYSGDYIKFRQLTVGYTLPESFLSSVPLIRTVQVSLVGRNLFTLMRKTNNIDPEAGFSTLIGYAGIEGTGVPSARTYGINLNVKFK